MSSWLIVLTGLIYAYIAIDQYIKGNSGMAITYFGYALGNVGLYMMAK
jgi:predicted hydrocarbon binding protein